jgi:hypothetical protein
VRGSSAEPGATRADTTPHRLRMVCTSPTSRLGEPPYVPGRRQPAVRTRFTKSLCPACRKQLRLVNEMCLATRVRSGLVRWGCLIVLVSKWRLARICKTLAHGRCHRRGSESLPIADRGRRLQTHAAPFTKPAVHVYISQQCTATIQGLVCSAELPAAPHYLDSPSSVEVCRC